MFVLTGESQLSISLHTHLEGPGNSNTKISERQDAFKTCSTNRLDMVRRTQSPPSLPVKKKSEKTEGEVPSLLSHGNLALRHDETNIFIPNHTSSGAVSNPHPTVNIKSICLHRRVIVSSRACALHAYIERELEQSTYIIAFGPFQSRLDSSSGDD